MPICEFPALKTQVPTDKGAFDFMAEYSSHDR